MLDQGAQDLARAAAHIERDAEIGGQQIDQRPLLAAPIIAFDRIELAVEEIALDRRLFAVHGLVVIPERGISQLWVETQDAVLNGIAMAPANQGASRGIMDEPLAGARAGKKIELLH